MIAKLAPLACAALVACGASDRPVAVEVPAFTAQGDPLPRAPADAAPRPPPTTPGEPPPSVAARPVLPPAPTAPSPAAASAEVLFQEARALLSQGRTAEACAKFDASMQLDAGLGTLVNLAACTEQLGDKPRACSLYRKAIFMTQKQGDAREQFVRSKAAALGCPP